MCVLTALLGRRARYQPSHTQFWVASAPLLTLLYNECHTSLLSSLLPPSYTLVREDKAPSPAHLSALSTLTDPPMTANTAPSAMMP